MKWISLQTRAPLSSPRPTSAPGKHRKDETAAGGFVSPSNPGHTIQTVTVTVPPPSTDRTNTEIYHPIESTKILLVSRLLEPVEDHALKIRVFNLFQY